MSKNSICIDARMIHHSGIGVYLKHVSISLLEKANFSITFLGKVSEIDKYFTGYTYKSIAFNAPIYSVSEQLILPFLVPECDVFWSPHFNVPLLPVRAKHRAVTIHDVYHLEYASSFPRHKQLLSSLLIRQACIRSERVFTVSKFSKEELLKRIEITDEKVIAIHNGIDKKTFHEYNENEVRRKVRNLYTLPERYILFVGNVKPNKNLKGLVKAFALLVEKLPMHKLLIVGKKDGFLTGDAALFTDIDTDKKLNDKVVFTGYVENEDLPVLYSMADVFAFPSVYEGFGLPPLEAMACGCPVVTSDRASMPEICGTAAEYVNPDDPVQFAEAIYQVVTNNEKRTDMIRNGLDWVKQYDWSATGQLFISQLTKIMVHGTGK